MFRNRTTLIVIILLVATIAGYYFYNASQPEEAEKDLSKSNTESGSDFLMTIVLKPQAGKSLDDIQKKLNESGFYKNFPPAGTQVESWKFVMGLGQVITLKVPPGKVREVNIAVEKMTWGPFSSEFYITYDFLPIYKAYRDTTTGDTTLNIME